MTITMNEVRTTVEANWAILKHSKYKDLAENIGTMIDRFFKEDPATQIHD